MPENVACTFDYLALFGGGGVGSVLTWLANKHIQRGKDKKDIVSLIEKDAKALTKDGALYWGREYKKDERAELRVEMRINYDSLCAHVNNLARMTGESQGIEELRDRAAFLYGRITLDYDSQSFKPDPLQQEQIHRHHRDLNNTLTDYF
ncbi:hypothetical protein ACQZV8_07065 [Magnetococcales bacterium HHB-1]